VGKVMMKKKGPMTDAHHYTDWVGSKEKKKVKKRQKTAMFYFLFYKYIIIGH
jgi:hypothetical protein